MITRVTIMGEELPALDPAVRLCDMEENVSFAMCPLPPHHCTQLKVMYKVIDRHCTRQSTYVCTCTLEECVVHVLPGNTMMCYSSCYFSNAIPPVSDKLIIYASVPLCVCPRVFVGVCRLVCTSLITPSATNEGAHSRTQPGCTGTPNKEEAKPRIHSLKMTIAS